MTNLERSCFFNDCGLLDTFPNQIAFTRKVQSGNIKFIQNLSPFGIADFAESAALQGARSTKVRLRTLGLASSTNLAIAQSGLQNV